MHGPQDVNRSNSRTWVRMNEDSRKVKHRQNFINEFGGEFINTHRTGYVLWREIQNRKEKRVFVFKSPDNELIEVMNVEKFCRDNNLTKSALYEVIAGNRKHHKKFEFIESKTINIIGPQNRR